MDDERLSPEPSLADKAGAAGHLQAAVQEQDTVGGRGNGSAASGQHAGAFLGVCYFSQRQVGRLAVAGELPSTECGFVSRTASFSRTKKAEIPPKQAMSDNHTG
jgi:hypothetical protein